MKGKRKTRPHGGKGVAWPGTDLLPFPLLTSGKKTKRPLLDFRLVCLLLLLLLIVIAILTAGS